MDSIKTLACASALTFALSSQADLVAHFSMDVSSGMIEETVSGGKYAVEGNFAPENLPGAIGEALRFDGYTSHIKASLGNIIPDSKTMTVSLWVATPSYPIIQIDTDTKEKTPIVTCLDKDKKTGFGFYLGFNGKYSFETYIGGWPLSVEADAPLATYQWNNLVAVIDCDARTTKLYCNGVEVGAGKAAGSVNFSGGDFYMGQGTESRLAGPFQLMSFNGLIDDISVWNEAKTQEEIASWKPETEANLDIPASRFADQLLRPRFHGMPAAGWTNECHGMTFSDGRYHLFFQKNADGPYMARLHWGHISSENLYDWREEKIAIAPGDWYDIKGCWSGCVFTDDEITGGKPNILYTAVDYAKAMIAQASPETDALDNWMKSTANPIINGRPAGLSDDFRDPYFFRSGDNAYIIVGSSKEGIGTTTLHRYDAATKTWSSSGEQFFTGTTKAIDGTFWEMPNITQMPDGRWLFTATPLGTSQGVRTLYWTGAIAANGKFVPDANSSAPRLVEMNSREGFGLLSPTIYNHDGKTIVLGIVPDKLPSVENWKLGWAHCYSLPREWSLAEDGSLIQRPFEGLKGLRGETMFEQSSFDLSGAIDLSPVAGRSVELCGTFEVGTTPFGFNVFKSSAGKGKIYYSPASGEIIADFSGLQRISNDGGVYDGIYRCPLPAKPTNGESLKINVFIDHSILDIFINDRWATSIRVFPTNADADGIEAFADSTVKVAELKAWTLDASRGNAVESVWNDSIGNDSIYNLQGMRLSSEPLSSGIYIANGKKVLVRK
ncbi:MAG: GH32 C-terminal domain-containing protein [Muribaculaceae bacterium]|nr:GH32 C-terminal domain-containing protein [Muribaculaceae bacterium]MDE6193004.1 GH32 C-terminal domain-containing protein [Muribaculaceae bacterium]MDE6855370.1 GH32 C-terminal domain-containing protein [Muribaculaceae bacterium]